MVVFIQTLWTQCPILGATLSILSTHQRQSKPLEQAIISRSAILCSCESPAVWWRLMYLRTVTGLKRDADLADLLYIEARSKSVCLCMLSCCVCLSLSLTQLDTYHGPLWLFPKPNSLCGFCIIVNHPLASALLTMSPTRLSVTRTKDRLGSWPWHPEPKRADAGIQLPSRV